MKKIDVIALWGEEGDSERMKLFFQKINPSLDQKERIKQLTLNRIQEQGEKSPNEPFADTELSFSKRARDSSLLEDSRFFKLLWKQRAWQIALPLVVVILLVWIGKGGLPSFFGTLPQQKNATETMTQSAPVQSSGQRELAKSNESLSSTADAAYSHAAGAPEQNISSPPEPSVANPDLAHKITYDINISLQVEDVNEVMASITQDIKKMGGYVAESQLDSSTANDSAHITLKVPANQLEGFQTLLPGLGKILNQQTTANDITSQYYDAETRLRNWEAQEQRYLELFKDAKNLDDILKVENALGNIRAQIEQLKGQLKLWDHEVIYSTVQLNLQTNSLAVNIEDPWQLISWAKTWQAAKDATLKTISFLWNTLNYLVVGFAYALPFLALGSILYGIYRFLRARRGM